MSKLVVPLTLVGLLPLSTLGAGGEEASSRSTVAGGSVAQNEIVVTAPMWPDETAASTLLDARAARQAAGPGASSPFKAIENTPSVNFQSADPYGLTEVGYHETLKIRGVGQTGPGSSRNIDELPLTVNPGGSNGILDMENVESVRVRRGAATVDKTLGFSNLPGKIDLTTRRPAEAAATQAGLTGGSDGFMRLFLRQDSGRQGIVAAFLSGSHSQGDKWKGNGEFDRQNLLFGMTLDSGEEWQAELFAGYNEDERHTYRFFNYKLASDFANRQRDWSANPASVDYFDYNRQHFDDRFVYASLRGRLTDNLQLVFKPYYLTESGNYLFSSINANEPDKSRVIDWLIDHDNMGALARLDWQHGAEHALRTGLWAQRQEPPGPPATQRKYLVTPSGLQFDGWQTLADHDPHLVLSPFVTYLGEFDALTFEAGLRYVDLRLGALTAYRKGGAAALEPDIDAALAAGGADAMASASARTLTEWLPCLGLIWRIDPETRLVTRLGRSYGLDVNLFPYYYAQQDAFKQRGVSLQSLWDRLEFETADQVDLGLRHERDDWHLGATSFYALHRNKQSTIYDPVAGVRYPWNTADANRYGVELEGAITPVTGLRLFGNYCWNRFEYAEDLALSARGSIPSDGKQVVDTPEHMVKLGASYDIGVWQFGAAARYLGARYGDVLNNERLGGTALVDISLACRLNRAMTLRLEVLNLFDKEYIGPVNAADDAIANFTAALNGVTGNGSSYQYGAPRTLFAGISADF